jgi:hypothetical protein
MPPPPGDAQLDSFVKGEIPKLAILYDRFANALDPFSPERDRAEIILARKLPASMTIGMTLTQTSERSGRRLFLLVANTLEPLTNRPVLRHSFLEGLLHFS